MSLSGTARRAARYLADDSHFCLAHADGIGVVDIGRPVECHWSSGAIATVTTAVVADRVERVSIENETVTRFGEKPTADDGWINAGYFVSSRRVVDYVEDDSTVFEREPLERLARKGQLSAFRRRGFRACWTRLRTGCALSSCVSALALSGRSGSARAPRPHTRYGVHASRGNSR